MPGFLSLRYRRPLVSRPIIWLRGEDADGDPGRHRPRPRFLAALGRGRSPASDSGAALERLLQRDPDALILAEDDGQLVGTPIAGWDGWRGGVTSTGWRLLQAGVVRASALGCFGAPKCGSPRLVRAVRTRWSSVRTELVHLAWEANGYLPQPEWERWIKPLDALG